MNDKSSVSDTSIAENNGTLCTNSSFCPPKTPITRDDPKTGRDEPCICGNGRKFRKRYGGELGCTLNHICYQHYGFQSEFYYTSSRHMMMIQLGPVSKTK